MDTLIYELKLKDFSASFKNVFKHNFCSNCDGSIYLDSIESDYHD